jgi:16S rRNA (uracil1498-N3)-methyltransferase
MHRFYIPALGPDTKGAALSDGDARHARNVLRLRKGDAVAAFDGEGREFVCEIDGSDGRLTTLVVLEEITPPAAESPLDLTLGAAVLKGERFELVIQKAVELGVKRLVPLISTRSAVKIGSTGTRVERWRKIAVEASKQCGRAALMKIDEIATLDDIIGGEVSGDHERILFSERGGEALDLPPGTSRITAVTGPEGGWDDAELEAASSAGFLLVTLHGRTLRAETAAIAFAAILQNRFGDLA